MKLLNQLYRQAHLCCAHGTALVACLPTLKCQQNQVPRLRWQAMSVTLWHYNPRSLCVATMHRCIHMWVIELRWYRLQLSPRLMMP